MDNSIISKGSCGHGNFRGSRALTPQGPSCDLPIDILFWLLGFPLFFPFSEFGSPAFVGSYVSIFHFRYIGQSRSWSFMNQDWVIYLFPWYFLSLYYIPDTSLCEVEGAANKTDKVVSLLRIPVLEGEWVNEPTSEKVRRSQLVTRALEQIR